MRDELSPAQLDNIFYGDHPVVVARFYDAEILDPTASKAAGKRIMKSKVMVELNCQKENARTVRPAQPEDSHTYKDDWVRYQKERRSEQGSTENRLLPDCDNIGVSLLKAQGQS